MKQKIILTGFVIIASLAFNILFWKEGFGINTTIFTLVSLLGIYLSDKSTFKNRNMQIISLGTLTLSIAILFTHSFFSIFIFLFSFVFLIGFSQQPSISFLGNSSFTGLMSLIEAPIKFFYNLPHPQWKRPNLGRSISLLSIPAAIFILFFFIYALANHKLALFVTDAIQKAYDFFFAMDISWARLLFIGIGFFIAAGLGIKNRNKIDFGIFPENIKREKKPKTEGIPNNFPTIGLKNEYKIAFMTILSLNGLLLLVNILDINHVWMKEVEQLNIWELKEFVYQGTYVLIFSIALAMGILIYFFRKNLNFFPNNKWLKHASYFWIAQNAFLTLSVGVRNFQYVQYYGLAYKRIGVFIFLFLTLLGFITMLIKINQKKSLQFLLNKNAWIWYFVFWSLSWVNWDSSITKYNIYSHYETDIDLDFLFKEVSDKNILILEQEKDILEERSKYSLSEIQNKIDIKKKNFMDRKETQTWLSWNYSDLTIIKNINK